MFTTADLPMLIILYSVYSTVKINYRDRANRTPQKDHDARAFNLNTRRYFLIKGAHKEQEKCIISFYRYHVIKCIRFLRRERERELA